MAIRRKQTQEETEQTLATQIGDLGNDLNMEADGGVQQEVYDDVAEEAPSTNMATQMIGKKLNRLPGAMSNEERERDKEFIKSQNLSRIGQKIGDTTRVREGWLPVDRTLLGERDIFYPSDWSFYIRPATVEAIRNWSMIDDQNGNSIDEVFNEVLKTCLQIKDSTDRPIPWHNICSWDRFFFLLLVREYTFQDGESNISYYEDCPECETPVEFNLTSDALMYDMPDEEVISYYDQTSRTWAIDPSEYEVEGDPITLYVPTLEKDANIKAWMIRKLQENRNTKIDPVFIRFVSWMTPKISKDDEISKRQMKQLKTAFDSLSIDQFEFMDEVLKNIIVTPKTKLITKCPSCGEEVTSDIRFPDGVGALFHVQSKRRRFGKK